MLNSARPKSRPFAIQGRKGSPTRNTGKEAVALVSSVIGRSSVWSHQSFENWGTSPAALASAAVGRSSVWSPAPFHVATCGGGRATAASSVRQ